MHEKDSSPQRRNLEEKGYYLPHYQGSELPSAMKYPGVRDLPPEDLPELATIRPIGELLPSSAEAVRLVQAFNYAPGRLPQTPNGTLLESLSGSDFDSHETPLASIGMKDQMSNAIVYLRHDKFVHAGDLKDFTNGRGTPKNGRPSKEVIGKYRGMSYETMPPVQHVVAYYEENSGKTFYSLVGDGTHRLARLAARRGDKYVPAVSVSFVRLDTNGISERLDKLSLQEAEPRRHFGHNILQRLGVRKSHKD